MALHLLFMTSRIADDAAVYRKISRGLQFHFALMHKAEKLIEKVPFFGEGAAESGIAGVSFVVVVQKLE